MTDTVCDCPEPCGCYAEGHAQGRDNAYLEMSNFDWTQHEKGCDCQPGVDSGRGQNRTLRG